MAGRGNPSFLKNQKAQKRAARATAKRADRAARRAERAAGRGAPPEDALAAPETELIDGDGAAAETPGESQGTGETP